MSRTRNQSTHEILILVRMKDVIFILKKKTEGRKLTGKEKGNARKGSSSPETNRKNSIPSRPQ